ncbi:hypothetical protein PhCBS80983_g04472 [Powellomyces hirtus]|uniref:Transmembrane protein n=1 Tax=Powellomyces hirtus TaxID=109895 RepID=A0A507DZE9_9FUNG|nr:hypothetical protein PhCBS80983_g04472 [Powellomyces hirtus]
MFSTAGVLGWDDPHTMPNYEVHRGYLRSLWIVPTVLGGLFAITMIGRFMATAMYYGALDVKEQLKSLKPGSRRDTRQEASSSAVEGGGAPGSVAAEIEALPSRASTLYGGEGEESGEEEETKSTLLKRWDRGAEAARKAFFLSLLIATICSLPIEYMCSGSPDLMPVPECTTCLTNGASLATVILSWVFFALSVVWVFLDLGLAHGISVAGTSLLMTLLAQPLIVAAFIITFRRWRELRDRTC